MRFLALHNGHDSSITAFEGGKPVHHLELERCLQIKHFAGVERGNALGDAIDSFLLPQLGWSHSDIEALIFSGLVPWGGDWSKTEFAEITRARAYGRELELPYACWESRWRGRTIQCAGISHHVNHMAYSYYTCPWTEALCIAIDGRGDFAINTAYGIGRGSRLEYAGNLTYSNRHGIPYNNIGIAYSVIGHLFPFIGQHPLSSAGKAMGLSSYGQPRDEWRPHVRKLLFPEEIGPYLDDEGVWAASKAVVTEIKRLVATDLSSPLSQDAQDLMATIQDEMEIYMVEMARSLSSQFGVRKLCLSGGCALNCQANSRILSDGSISELFIPPACSDSGLSIGAGLYFHHALLGIPFEGMQDHNPYLGSEVSAPTKVLLADRRLKKEEFSDDGALIHAVGDALLSGKILAWMRGRAEIGPRALGNRSILALPSPKGVWDRINSGIKHREFWRPFASVCPLEDVAEWYEIDHPQPYMLECPKVRQDKRRLMEAVTHVDGTSRVQTVTASSNPELYSLLRYVGARTGVPILLNTSLNDHGKPLANHGDDALRLLLTSELDLAVVGRSIFSKSAIKFL